MRVMLLAADQGLSLWSGKKSNNGQPARKGRVCAVLRCLIELLDQATKGTRG